MTDTQIELIGGLVLGQTFRFLQESSAAAAEERKHKLEMAKALYELEADEIKAARSFALQGGGTWVRRIISVLIVLFITGGLYMAAQNGWLIQVGEYVERTGLLGRVNTKLVMHEVTGFVLLPETWSLARMVFGFYLGQGVKFK